EDVEGRARDPARADRLGERRLVDDAPAGAIDDPDAGLDPGQLIRTEQVARVLDERHVDRDEVRAREQLLQLDGLDALTQGGFATAVVLPPGVFITTTPRSVAASTSIVSTPAPARPTTSSARPASSTARVTLVALRTIRPSYSPMRAMSSRSASVSTTSTSSPCLRSASTPTALRPSVTRIRFTASRRRSSGRRGRRRRSPRAGRG